MEENSKHFWKFIKGGRQDSTGIAALGSNGQLESDPKIKAEILNNFFKSVFTKEDEENMPILPPSKYPNMPDLNITETGVIKLLSNLNPNKASGPEEIPGRLLKLAAAQIAPSLTFIFNQSLRTGDLPEDYRKANISPIYKKENRTNPGNYRPVSLTCICCKLFEHIIHSQIMDFFDKHGILSNRQHGFRSERSCETQLLITIDDLAKSIDKRKQTDIIILDFSKAFDTVPHARLISKLSHYGIRGNTLRWISNFLCELDQQIVIDGHASIWESVTSGVPQGSVLGPLLFLAYINDLPESVKSDVRLFADDFLLYRTINSKKDARTLQKDLDAFTQWQNDWQMRFNA